MHMPPWVCVGCVCWVCVSLRLVSQVLSEHAQYNEKADVYSFGIMIWYVSQHLYLARNTQLFRTATEHRSFMTPYRFGERVVAICTLL
jgi:hypothetical protein